MDTPGSPSIEQILSAMTPEERRRVGALREARARIDTGHPLAVAELWDRPAPRTSQRRAVRAVVAPGIMFGFLLGGNRTGKTEAAAQIAVAVAQGRDHPDTVDWCARNGVDLSRVGSGPGVVVMGSPDSNDSRRFLRPKVARYLPSGTRWRNRDGTGEAEAVLPCGGKIVFKSVDQGRDGWQGFAARLVIFDEEPLDLAVVSEALMRIADDGGWILLPMTPLSGWTPLLREHVREPAPDVAVVWLHGEDNPHVDPEILAAIYKKFGPHERAARSRGEIVALEGRVYEDWRRDLHVVPSFDPPEEWVRIAAVDWGTRNPCGILWGAIDPADDTLHIYREMYETQRTYSWLARQFLALSGGEQIDHIVADPEDRGARLEWLQSHDIRTVAAYKGPGSVRSGISAVAERLALGATGRPSIVIHDRCQNAIREIEGYVWDTTRSSKNDLPDRPLKKDDHLMDSLRYLVQFLQRMYVGQSED